MTVRVPSLALLLLACACAPRAAVKREAPAPAAAPKPEPVQVRVEPVGDAWQVTYTFPAPVQAVRFGRRGYGFRQTHWRVEEPKGAHVREVADARDELEAGAPFQTVRLRITPYTEKPEKDYQVFIPYSGGGWLLYTGALDVEVPEEDAPELAERFTLVPGEGAHVVVGGRASDRPVAWEGSSQGTYAYFGKDPVVQDGVAAVVDAGMPERLRAQVSALLPRLFSLYAERTGQPLTFTPTLFVTYGEHPVPGSISNGGGTLPGVLQLDFRLGRARQREDDLEAQASVLELVAHESAHVWNGQLFQNAAEPGNDWMHEGGAEAFALEALVELGALPAEHYRARLSGAVSECLFNLEGAPLTASSRPGKYTNYYRCGLALFAVAEASARARDAQADVFTLWQRVFAHAGATRTYDEAGMFAAFEEAGVDTATLALLRRLVHGPTEGLGGPLLAALERLGFAPEASDAHAPADFRGWVGRRVVRLALQGACEGAPQLVPSAEGLRVEQARCGVLGERPVVKAVAWQDVRREPFAAYDALRAQCAKDASVPVLLAGRGEAVPVPCVAPVPERPPYVRVGRVPLARLPLR